MADDKLQKAFAAMDEDGDGFIDQFELKKALELAGLYPSIQEVNDLIKEVDINKNGVVEISEFQSLWEKINSNEYAAKVGGMTRLKTLRMQDAGKYPEPNKSWKKINSSGFYGSTGGGVYKKDQQKKPPPPRNINDLP